MQRLLSVSVLRSLGLAAGLWGVGAISAADFEVTAGYNNDFYTSAMVITSTLKHEPNDEDDAESNTFLGDPYGMVQVDVEATDDDQPIVVEVSSTKIIKKSKFVGTLSENGETYTISPVLKYDYDTLLSIHQPVPEDVTVKVTRGDEVLGEETVRVVVRSINDVVLAVEYEGGEIEDTTFMFAAYVNENHPVVDEILAEALNLSGGSAGSENGAGDEQLNAFAGYQGDKESVAKELTAIWNALQARGFRYCDISKSSTEDQDGVASQYVRLLGDSTKTSQANCVEGSCLFASICRKLGMDTMLVTVPGHMYVGVFLDKEHQSFLPIETTMLGGATLEEAVTHASESFDSHAEDLISSLEEEAPVNDCMLIDIAAWRKKGILPIKETVKQ